jgi:hypothetical protein
MGIKESYKRIMSSLILNALSQQLFCFLTLQQYKRKWSVDKWCVFITLLFLAILIVFVRVVAVLQICVLLHLSLVGNIPLVVLSHVHLFVIKHLIVCEACYCKVPDFNGFLKQFVFFWFCQIIIAQMRQKWLNNIDTYCILLIEYLKCKLGHV